MRKMIKTVSLALEKGEGVLRLFPTWVPREFSYPGMRLKLYPDDYYAFGIHRGGINQRWLASTVKAENGPDALEDEGLSYICIDTNSKKEKFLLKDATELIGSKILGEDIMKKYGGWTMLSKFFDNLYPLPYHLHLDNKSAEKVNKIGKAESYYFPKQLNNYQGNFPYSFFGLNPNVKRNNIKKCLENWDKKDNGILYFSKAYKLKTGTGWNIPAGFLHAPGSLVTYEPQVASDVFSIFQNCIMDKHLSWEVLVKDVPKEHRKNLDYIVDTINWDLNLDSDFSTKQFLEPKPVKPIDEMRDEGYEEYWLVNNSYHFSAKELTVFPNRSVNIKENYAYGVITIQGHGEFGVLYIESPTIIKFGQMTNDELFVTVNAAREGILITNRSRSENLVMLKHFGPII